MDIELVGLFVAIVAAIANGSFGVPLRLARTKTPGMLDSVFQAYWAIGVAATSVATVPVQCLVFGGACFKFEPLGCLGGLAASLATVFVLTAIRHLGVAIPPSIYATSFIFSGMIEGAVYFADRPNNTALLLLALALVGIGALGVAGSKYMVTSSPPHLQIHPQNEDEFEQPRESLVHANPAKRSFAIGCVSSALVGITGSFAPFVSKFANSSPFAYVPSFGLGVLLVHIVCIPLLCCMPRAGFDIKGLSSEKQLMLRSSMPYGILSGSLWGIGNAGLGFALTAHVPFPLAVSIYQCGLLVSGLWGIFYFHEIRGPYQVGLFLFSALLLLSGVVLESSVFGS